MLSPSEIQRVEVLVGMEMPTNLASAAGLQLQREQQQGLQSQRERRRWLRSREHHKLKVRD